MHQRNKNEKPDASVAMQAKRRAEKCKTGKKCSDDLQMR